MKNKNNIKYLITAPYSPKGGVASFVQNILPCFKDTVKIFSRGSRFNGHLTPFNFLLTFLLPFKFLFCLVSNRPSVVIINSSLSLAGIIRDGLLIFIAKIFKFKVLLIIHGFDEKALRYGFFLKIGYYKANAIMVLSDKFLEKLVGTHCTVPIHTFYNPVSLELLNALDQNDNFMGKDLLSLLFIARIEKEKGIYTCIDAFQIASLTFPDLTLTIAGDGTEFKNVKEYLEKKKVSNVVLKGFVKGTEKHDLFMDSDILVFPTSHNEGLPINVLEAMTAGMLIITRPVGGLVDLYNAIEFGIMTEAVNAEKFAEIIINVIKSKQFYNEIRTRNYVFARQNFHPSIVVAKIENILSGVE